FFGTKATLILRHERDALLFEEGNPEGGRATAIEVAPKAGGPALDASESRPANAPSTAASRSVGGSASDRPSATRFEIAGFCEAVRVGKPVASGPERAMHSARACIMANESIAKKGPLTT